MNEHARVNPFPAREERDEPVPYDYCKYHGLGNDYLVIDPARFAAPLSAAQVRAICDRHMGVGGDGILFGPLPGHEVGVPALRIYNPDGSEGEKSGNGLRIFSRYLWEEGCMRVSPFEIDTPGGRVRVQVLADDGSRIAIAMGRVSFTSGDIPMTGESREVLRERIEAGGRSFTICAANVGNPHCVVLDEEPAEALAREVGPLLENHPAFPNRTNVQFLAPLDRHTIHIQIWERGAGYTLASGTSSCATAAVACRLGLVESPVTVRMPGGELEIRVGADFQVEMEGEVRAVSRGDFSGEFLAGVGLTRR